MRTASSNAGAAPQLILIRRPTIWEGATRGVIHGRIRKAHRSVIAHADDHLGRLIHLVQRPAVANEAGLGTPGEGGPRAAHVRADGTLLPRAVHAGDLLAAAEHGQQLGAVPRAARARRQLEIGVHAEVTVAPGGQPGLAAQARGGRGRAGEDAEVEVVPDDLRDRGAAAASGDQDEQPGFVVVVAYNGRHLDELLGLGARSVVLKHDNAVNRGSELAEHAGEACARVLGRQQRGHGDVTAAHALQHRGLGRVRRVAAAD